jgi:Ca2+-binding RTX toxin-like protein
MTVCSSSGGDVITFRAGLIAALATAMAGILPPIAAVGAAATPTCFGMAATIVGTDGDDVLTGTDGDDVIVGLGGTDAIYPRAGNDRVCAGPNPVRFGADGIPVYEVVGRDPRSGTDFGAGVDLVDGGPGLDRITEGFGEGDRVYGGSNPTVVDAQGRRWFEELAVNGDARVYGQGGDDHIRLDATEEVTRAGIAFGGPGNDTIDGYSETMPNLRMYGGPGADRITVINDRGLCLLVGGPGSDQLRSSGGVNELRGGPDNDTLVVRGDNLSLFGDTNTIVGGIGNDRLDGSAGADILRGGRGKDRLLGRGGRDRLDGGSGRNNNNGGRGRDLCRNPDSGPRTHSCES